jgi:CBS domain-containing protein
MDVVRIMTKSVKVCRPGDSLNRAAKLMWDHDCGCVVVVDDNGGVVGMLTDRDICMAGYFRNAPLTDIRVSDVMATNVVSVKPSDDISIAEALMQANQIRRLPVLSDARKLVGILSINDVARFARTPAGRRSVKSEGLAATLATICSPRSLTSVTNL